MEFALSGGLDDTTRRDGATIRGSWANGRISVMHRSLGCAFNLQKRSLMAYFTRLALWE